jgi:hypothetical protein
MEVQLNLWRRIILNNNGKQKILNIIGDECKVCKDKKVEIHHKKYFHILKNKKPFTEEMINKIKKYLIPLCRKHHQQRH